MKPKRYSQKQLENVAVNLISDFDKERLYKCKPLDVYEVIEKCLNVPYGWEYITPDQSVLGLTVFRAGVIKVWPEPYYEEGMMPYERLYEKGTILIDTTLTEQKERGMENFTVMHEVFHQILHKSYFSFEHPDYCHYTKQGSYRRRSENMSPLEICEYQANYCAAAFLMSAAVIEKRFAHCCDGYKMDFDNQNDRNELLDMAQSFSVTKTALKYRLINLGYANPEKWD